MNLIFLISHPVHLVLYLFFFVIISKPLSGDFFEYSYHVTPVEKRSQNVYLLTYYSALQPRFTREIEKNSYYLILKAPLKFGVSLL